MARKKYSPEDIIQILRTYEIEQSKGLKGEEAAKKVGVAYQTLWFHRNSPSVQDFGLLVTMKMHELWDYLIVKFSGRGIIRPVYLDAFA